MIRNQFFLLVWWVTLLIWLSGCGGGQQVDTVQTGPVQVTVQREEQVVKTEETVSVLYQRSGGQPPVTAQLQIGADGQAELYLGSSYSLPGEPLDRVGFFGSAVAPEQWAGLQRHIAERDLMEQAGGAPPESPDPTTGYITLSRGERRTRLILSERVDGEDLVRLEEMLLEIMAALIEHPERVTQVKLRPLVTEAMVRPEVTITNIGHEPLSLLLFDPQEIPTFLKVQLALMSPDSGEGGERRWQTVSASKPGREDIEALVNEGAIPRGVQALAPGEQYLFSLPGLPLEAEEDLYLGGTFTFWLAGEGPARRAVYIQAAPVPLGEQR